MNPVETKALGYVGNVWVKMNYLRQAGDRMGGHTHKFDHVSLLARGKVRVEIKGYPPREFSAPTFIVIKKEHEHDFVALEDNSLWYCVFAVRDIDGNVEDIYGVAHDPLGLGAGDLASLNNTIHTT